MKKILATAAIILALAAAFTLGRSEGKRHVLEDAVIWTVDCYNPDDPDACAYGEYDQCIYIEIDGDVFAHGMYQG